MRKVFAILILTITFYFSVFSTSFAQTVSVAPTVETQAATNGTGDIADDPSIWLHPQSIDQSLIIATNKASSGGIEVYDLKGQRLQFLPDGTMNGVDIRYNFPFGTSQIDIACATNRKGNIINCYRINASTRRLEQIGEIRSTWSDEIYGFCMYRSKNTGKYYAIANDKSGILKQFELSGSGGQLTYQLVRTFDIGSQPEGCVADDELGHLYVGEEARGVWKYGAEPNQGSTRTTVDTTSGGHLRADVEGMAIYYRPNGQGYLIVSSQGDSTFAVYDRAGNNAYLGQFRITASGSVDAVGSTDGLDVTNVSLGSSFPQGMFIAHDGSNSGDSSSNYKIVPWQVIASQLNLTVDTSHNPRNGFSGGSQTPSPVPTSKPTSPASSQTPSNDADANKDGKVDNSDYQIWLNNYRKNVAGGVSEGDFNKSGIVDGVDFAIWRKLAVNLHSPVSTPRNSPTSTPRPTVQATVRPETPQNTTPTPTPVPPPVSQSSGIWISSEELRSKPTSGDAWNAVLSSANNLSNSPTPDLDNQDDDTNVQVLAAAIVYARTGDTAYRNKVVNALRYIEGFVPNGRTLAWGRETGAYAIAADLIGYRTPAFEKKMRDMAETYIGSQTGKSLLNMYKSRPNNWGSMAFGSLTAIYRYLGDTNRLREVRDFMAQSITGPKPASAVYGSLSWQYQENQPRWINPKGATKTCSGVSVNVDGIIPDDMRRGGSCNPTPAQTGYPWEGLQGFLMGTWILARAGMPITTVDDNAVCRAVSALQDGRFGASWRASGDDEWQLPFWDKLCGRNWSAGYGNGKWGAGKNTGWGYIIN